MKNRAPRRWVQILNVSVWRRNMLLAHPRNEYIGGRWLCWRNSLSLSQSGRESNGIECHAQLTILLIFELIFFSRSGIEMVGNKEGEDERFSISCVVGSLDWLSGLGVFFEDFECCLRLPLEAGIAMGQSEMSDLEVLRDIIAFWWLSHAHMPSSSSFCIEWSIPWWRVATPMHFLFTSHTFFRC